MHSCTSPIIVALDFDDIVAAKRLVAQLSPQQCRLKVGKEMFTLYGPDWVRYLQDIGFDVFLDLKFHDIPNTVAKAVNAAAQLGVWMVNVHASGGADMIHAAKDASLNSKNPLLLTAVTILTSMDDRQFSQVYDSSNVTNKVLQLASLAQEAGADGVVCSAKEASLLRRELRTDFRLVTPGIRPVGANNDDQKRVVTPQDAISAGVDYLVIGRPITKAPNPAEVLVNMNRSLGL